MPNSRRPVGSCASANGMEDPPDHSVVRFALRGRQDSRDRDLAEDLLKSKTVQQIELSDADDPPAYQAGSRAALLCGFWAMAEMSGSLPK